jgi:hypothetical protein
MCPRQRLSASRAPTAKEGRWLEGADTCAGVFGGGGCWGFIGVAVVKKYMTADRCGNSITEVEVLRETALWVFLPAQGRRAERRESKISYVHRYHDSWDEAHEYLLERARVAIERARRTLQHAEIAYCGIENMKPVENAAVSQ